MKKPTPLYALALFLVFLFLIMAGPASAASYVFLAPAGMSTYLPGDGNSYVPDANRMVLVSDVNLVLRFVGAGFMLISSSTPTASHDYGAAHADWTLSTAESAAQVLSVSNASQAANIIAAPTLGKKYLVMNSSGFTITIKGAGQSGIAVLNATVIPVVGNGTDFAAEAITSSSISGATIDNSIIGGTTPVSGTFTTVAYSTFASATHDYSGGHADWTLSASEGRARIFTTTNAGTAGANAILPSGFVGVFFVSNTSGQTVTWKYSASTGVANANGKKQVLVADGVEVYSLKADY